MKDIKHIRRDFYCVTWVMPQWWDLGVPCGVILFQNLTRFGVWVTYMMAHHATARFLVPHPWVKISLNLNYEVNFKDF